MTPALMVLMILTNDFLTLVFGNQAVMYVVREPDRL
jgi:hypothetical protein